MKIKMPSGVILECFDDDLNNARLEQGGVVYEEIKETVKENEKDNTGGAPAKRGRKTRTVNDTE